MKPALARGLNSPLASGVRPCPTGVASSYAHVNRAAREAKIRKGRAKPSPAWTREVNAEYDERYNLGPDPLHLDHYQEGGRDE